MENEFDLRLNHYQGKGWAFPVSFTAGNQRVAMSRNERNIEQSIDIILKTAKGERSMRPGFGSGLQQFFFRKMDESLKTEISVVVRNTLLRSEPRISVREVTVDYPDHASGLVHINITYEFNQANTRHNYVFPFYIQEGTNLTA